MPPRRRRASVARYAAPAAFLAAATIAVLLVRAALRDDASPRSGTNAVTQPTLTATTTRTGRTATAATRTARDPRRFYRIQPGDTLAVVADRFGTTVDRLLALNPAVDPVSLRVGQRIRVR